MISTSVGWILCSHWVVRVSVPGVKDSCGLCLLSRVDEWNLQRWEQQSRRAAAAAAALMYLGELSSSIWLSVRSLFKPGRTRALNDLYILIPLCSKELRAAYKVPPHTVISQQPCEVG